MVYKYTLRPIVAASTSITSNGWRSENASERS